MKTLISQIIDEELLAPCLITESNDEFIRRICSICLTEIENNIGFSPLGYGLDVINEIELIVSEVFKIKTYAYFIQNRILFIQF